MNAADPRLGVVRVVLDVRNCALEITSDLLESADVAIKAIHAFLVPSKGLLNAAAALSIIQDRPSPAPEVLAEAARC